MPRDHDTRIEALDALLKEVAESPTVREIRERAADSGHLDDDWIMALSSGGASEEELVRARRHVVFCDQCANLLLQRGGEVQEGEIHQDREPSPKVATTPSGKRTLTRREALMVGTALALVVVFALFLHRLGEFSFMNESPEEIPGKVEPLIVGARGSKDVEKGRLSLSRLAYLRLRERDDVGRAFVYVLLVDAQGRCHRLLPESGNAREFDFSREVELPSRFGGIDLKALGGLGAGERVGFFVFLHGERIGVLEGEIFERVTRPKIEKEARSLGNAMDEAMFRTLSSRLKALGLPGRILFSSIRLIP